MPIEVYFNESEIPSYRLVMKRLAELNPRAAFYDKLDEALVGIAYISGEPPVALYDRTIALSLIRKKFKMNEHDALRILEDELAGAFLESTTPPIFAEIWK